MNLLKPFFDNPEGISLKSDGNGKYLSLIRRDDRWRIEAAKDNKDVYTRFLVKKSSDGKRVLLQAVNEQYCSLILRGDISFLEAAKKNADVFCEFEAFTVENKLVLKGANSKFLSVIERGGDHVQSIEAAKLGIDAYCKFIPSIGDIIPPKFEILDVTWDSSRTSVIYNPTVVTEDSYCNGGSNPIVQEIDLKWSHKSIETTTWNNAWGFEFSYSYKSSIKGVTGSVIAESEYKTKISYSGSHGTSSTDENEASFSRKVKITAAPNKKTTASMIVKKADNVELPFTAKILRTNADGSQKIMYEKGTWSGVSYHSVYIKVIEQDL